jgi:hypothetical protein
MAPENSSAAMNRQMAAMKHSSRNTNHGERPV